MLKNSFSHGFAATCIIDKDVLTVVKFVDQGYGKWSCHTFHQTRELANGWCKALSVCKSASVLVH